MRKLSKKQKIAAAGTATVIAIAGGGVAYAFWSGNGTGNGSAATSTGASGITVNQTSTITGLAPGGDPVGLSGNFTNSNPGGVYVHSVSVAVDPNWSSRTETTKPACTAADFQLAQPTLVDATVAPGSGGSWSGGSIKMLDASANQDNCKGLSSIPLVYSSN